MARSCETKTNKNATNTSNGSFGVATQFNALNLGINAAGNNGFFSASKFTVEALDDANFGEYATLRAGDTDVKDVPFKVLFFDNEGSDNGLYVYSGTADYDEGVLTNINYGQSPNTLLPTSNPFGKHTIVKVTGEKGHPIALSDINLV